jgi:hypothetical protein
MISRNTVETKTFDNCFGRYLYYRMINALGNHAYLVIVTLAVLLRLAIVLYSTYSIMPNWQKKETDLLLNYIQEMRSSQQNPLLGGAISVPLPLKTTKGSSTHSVYGEVSPMASYILYSIGWIGSILFGKSTTELTDSQKVQLVFIGKLFLLALDSTLLIFSTTLYVRLSYGKYKSQLRSCYLGIILLCPSFFLKEYLHFDFHNLGYHLLFLTIFMHEVEEYLLVGVLSGVLVNLHTNYFLMLPFLFTSLVNKAKRTRFYRELGIMKLASFAQDILTMVIGFVAAYLMILIPWFAHSEDFFETLDMALGAPLRKSLVEWCLQ